MACERGMDEIKNMMLELMNELKELRKDQKVYHEEMIAVKAENKALKEKLGYLENKIEKMDKAQRKLNIVITGIHVESNIAKETVEKFVEEKIGTKINVNEVSKIGINKNNKMIIMAKLNSWEDKEKVMKNKNKLRGTPYYIDPDYTEGESQTQRKLREIARVERGKGKRVTVGFQKLNINGEWMLWEKDADRLVKIDKERSKNY